MQSMYFIAVVLSTLLLLGTVNNFVSSAFADKDKDNNRDENNAEKNDKQSESNTNEENQVSQQSEITDTDNELNRNSEDSNTISNEDVKQSGDLLNSCLENSYCINKLYNIYCPPGSKCIIGDIDPYLMALPQ